MVNKYLVATGLCYALTTPIGVHVGYLMAQGNWTMVVVETAFLMCLHMMAPTMWVKAQTKDLKETSK